MDYKKYKFEVVFSDRKPINVECTRDYLFTAPFCKTASWLVDEDVAIDKTGAHRNVCVYPASLEAKVANFIADGVKIRCDVCAYNKKNHTK